MRHLIGFVLACAAATFGSPAFAAMPLSPCGVCKDAQKDVQASGQPVNASVYACGVTARLRPEHANGSGVRA